MRGGPNADIPYADIPIGPSMSNRKDRVAGNTDKSPWARKLEDSARQQHTRRGKPLSSGVPGKGPLSVRHATTDSLD